MNKRLPSVHAADGTKTAAIYRWHNGLSLDPLENTGTNLQGTNSTMEIRYCGNKVYNFTSLKYILTDNGFIKDDQYYFYIKDHLGNVAAVKDAAGSTVQQTYYHPYGKIIESLSYEQDLQPYLFGGKERENMMGLSQSDFLARTLNNYGRFNTVDPLAEKYYSISPYAYCLNNPINRIDPDGNGCVPL
jgi:RHS repeat-associated protein